MRGYIYLISFKNTCDIYIGKTIDVKNRFKSHKYSGTVSKYVKSKLDNDWSNVMIDIIDSISMDEDITHLITNPFNPIIEEPSITYPYNKYTGFLVSNVQLLNYRLTILEQFHMLNYMNSYNLINILVPSEPNLIEKYQLFTYNKVFIKKND